MRIGLFVKSISPLATIRFYSPGADSAVEVSGKDVLATIQSNTSQGDQSDEARTYWGPYLAGAQGVVEIELPKGVDASTAQVAIPRITHFFLDPLDSKVLTTGAKQSGYCEVDVSCKTPLPAASNAVALMLFSKNGGAYSCTGTLLNEVGGSGTPYFLTAYHCISSQTVASSLETYWFYRSSACNNGILNPGYQSRSGGARLLYTRQTDSGPGGAGPAGTDTSFMVLNSTPPAGAIYAGWTTVGQAPSATNLYQGIHHPFGDLQKTSEGTVTTFAYVNGPTATTSPLQSGWPMYNVRFTSGTTELGSSVSALFFNGFSSSAANPQLVGQLLGGNSSCANPTGTNLYGRFDLPYLDGMYLWLSGYLQPVYRFYNTRTNAHFFTSSVIERDRVKLTNSDFSYEGSAFQTSPRAGNSVSPVYRFYNTSTGTHFYTISPAERNSIIARLPNTPLKVRRGMPVRHRQAGLFRCSGFITKGLIRTFIQRARKKKIVSSPALQMSTISKASRITSKASNLPPTLKSGSTSRYICRRSPAKRPDNQSSSITIMPFWRHRCSDPDHPIAGVSQSHRPQCCTDMTVRVVWSAVVMTPLRYLFSTADSRIWMVKKARPEYPGA